MVSGTDKKIKVAWICHFTDKALQSKLPIWKESAPFGAWIRNTLEGFKNSEEFEIHVIAPHQYLKRNFSFKEDGIYFHFFKVGIPIFNRSWPSFLDIDLKTNYFFNKRRIARIIDKIHPDLINLQGAENAYYSSSVLDLYQKYPTLVSIQGFVFLESSIISPVKKKRIEIESQIFKKLKYFGGEVDSKEIIKKMRKESFYYYHYYYPNSSNITKLQKENHIKEYDLLFWSRIIKDKGAEDFLYLVAKLKEKLPDITASYVGPVSKLYFEFLKNKAMELGCYENISFIGFINEEAALYEKILKARILVLPTYNDRFPTVLREAVCLKIAVISYPTGSIPQFNMDEERILLSPEGDIVKLAENAMKLLKNEDFYSEKIEMAYNHGIREFSIENNCYKLKESYKSILNI